MDERDKILLEAQKAFFEQISAVRRELADDAKEMRHELIEAFNRAHDENKERMEAIVKALGEHDDKDQKHYADDDRRFTVFNRVAFMLAGALGLLMVLIQLWNAFKK